LLLLGGEITEEGWRPMRALAVATKSSNPPNYTLNEDVSKTARRGQLGDLEKALTLLTAALETATEIGLKSLVEKVRSLMLVPQGRPATAEPAVQSGERNVFRLEGEFWTIVYGGPTLRMKDSAGLRALAHLLGDPGREFHVLDLVIGEKDPSGGALGDAGPGLDSKAKEAYRRRLEDLREELREAEEFHDPGRASNARAEIESIGGELARAVGLGGRDRKLASTTERARWRITKTLRAAIRRIAADDASLAHHFDTCVRTGTFFCYHPDPNSPLRWQIEVTS
jgi:hypothetical protein